MPLAIPFFFDSFGRGCERFILASISFHDEFKLLHNVCARFIYKRIGWWKCTQCASSFPVPSPLAFSVTDLHLHCVHSGAVLHRPKDTCKCCFLLNSSTHSALCICFGQLHLFCSASLAVHNCFENNSDANADAALLPSLMHNWLFVVASTFSYFSFQFHANIFWSSGSGSRITGNKCILFISVFLLCSLCSSSSHECSNDLTQRRSISHRSQTNEFRFCFFSLVFHAFQHLNGK